MEQRLIDANALLELMRTYDDYQGAKEAHDLELIHRDSILFAIETVPTVDAVPVVHGEWVYKNRHRKSYRRYTGVDDFGETHTITVLHETDGKEPYCPYCGAQAAESFQNYCPNCGAKMDGKENNDG